MNGVNFITLDDVYGTVSSEQATRFEKEVKKGLPIILCMHCPFDTPAVHLASDRFWRRKDLKGIYDMSAWQQSFKDDVTKDFVAWLKAQPLLKAILAGHLRLDVQDRFSPTAMEYDVGGNFLFHGEELATRRHDRRAFRARCRGAPPTRPPCQ